VKQSLKNAGKHISMDAPFAEGEDSNLYDVISASETPMPDSELVKESIREEIGRVLETLSEREADVVKLYYGIGQSSTMTLDEIGNTFDLTRERVRQIREKAIRKLRKSAKSDLIQSFID
jgi:RNA polymerase primary sigma factor